ncbi:hypothetical protein FQN57_002454 [Myotisia sp. PD_48]|nr:hypothetical protein FQN57_002454 [Myotisia sp. PD_48]
MNNPARLATSQGASLQSSIFQIHSQQPAVLLAVYPVTLLIGSLFSRISPTANPSRSSRPDLLTASEVHEPINYFAQKANIFNVYFVKIGWLWTTLAFMSILLTQPAFTNSRISPESRLRRAGQAVCRYGIVTLSWILTTQWCFGPAVIDRSFIATGGKCESLRRQGQLDDSTLNPSLVLTSVLCKASGGVWQGGHDVSGHAFMLVLTNAFLIFELLGAIRPTLSAPKYKSSENNNKSGDTMNGQLINKLEDIQSNSSRLSLHFVLAVVGLAWWMLLMTGIWFHTWLEKVS